ncbi:AraC family transcriptional regulator [Terrimonas sp. NA20]|uniref:AraC family transcriptional regulator n=1 Tax=Terrimonas ginsenosidimutans TaxID=2908004 RepID=A0ABS9KUG3_9BACT|nr:AraC family transcriptional regulator [Terrimonas ginsenosidimutans]MCG2615928.1 AraC family transcriptional regulator [Terrimonas ginsenosidimutans]
MPALNPPVIQTSCDYCETSSGESLVQHFVLGYQTEGSLHVFDGVKNFQLKTGTYWLAVKNKLARFRYVSDREEEYKAISVTFPDQELLNFSHEYEISSSKKIKNTAPVITLKEHPLLKSFFAGLAPYASFSFSDDDPLMKLKLKEALVVLLKCQPELKDLLFDFSDPHKTDLAAFMENNFQFNLPLSQFAYLTGRSLSAFKRDFEKIYGITPAKWLLQKRLDKAHFLLKERKMKVSDVYAEVGFEDASHFSFAFKKQYNVNASVVGKEAAGG